MLVIVIRDHTVLTLPAMVEHVFVPRESASRAHEYMLFFIIPLVRSFRPSHLVQRPFFIPAVPALAGDIDHQPAPNLTGNQLRGQIDDL